MSWTGVVIAASGTVASVVAALVIRFGAGGRPVTGPSPAASLQVSLRWGLVPEPALAVLFGVPGIEIVGGNYPRSARRETMLAGLAPDHLLPLLAPDAVVLPDARDAGLAECHQRWWGLSLLVVWHRVGPAAGAEARLERLKNA
jgi:hypothetical protein